jgi:signal peptidase I
MPRMADTPRPAAATASEHDHGITETLKSLVMAFVLAMTFRGFVTEGFVIPTGSMAPTLMGRHELVHSDATGSTFRVGMDTNQPGAAAWSVADPMLGPGFEGWGTTSRPAQPRNGDRILVLKTLYPFFEPERFDVVVFKNPTEPHGDSANYIKRLIGLPNEKIWLADGDVFAGPADDPERIDDYVIQRKPEHVQRAVWQLVHHSDFVPGPDPAARIDFRYPGSPWSGEGWTTDGTRIYECDTAAPTVLTWNNDVREIDDWTAYNQGANGSTITETVCDIRVGAGVTRAQAGLRMTLQLVARSHVFEFIVTEDSAAVRMRPLAGVAEWVEDVQPISLGKAGKVFAVEFWHVDQSMSIYLDGERVAYLEYDWLPLNRLRYATGTPAELASSVDRMIEMRPDPAEIAWRFEGSPVALHRVRVDRDLHYQATLMRGSGANLPRQGYADLVGPGWGFGTHPTKPAVLGPDHFWMLGDNSARSQDGRVWGSPHMLVAEQIDPSPFVVHRKLMIGKAWVVYFPAMYPLSDRGASFIPDFGRMRFIR